MKPKYFTIGLFFIAGILILILNRYNWHREKETALSYYALAEDMYMQNKLDSSISILDSLKSRYGHIEEVVFSGNKLRLTIDKQLYSDSLAQITEILNQYAAKENDAALDSLKKRKHSYKNIYLNIEKEEKQYECPQCAVYMQNARKR